MKLVESRNGLFADSPTAAGTSCAIQSFLPRSCGHLAFRHRDRESRSCKLRDQREKWKNESATLQTGKRKLFCQAKEGKNSHEEELRMSASAALAPHVAKCRCYVRRMGAASHVRGACSGVPPISQRKCNAADLRHAVEQLSPMPHARH